MQIGQKTNSHKLQFSFVKFSCIISQMPQKIIDLHSKLEKQIKNTFTMPLTIFI